MFCHVTRALRGVILRNIQIARDAIARTTTAKGLRVVAEIARRKYSKGIKASVDFISSNPIRPSDFLRQLNYTAPWIAML